MKNIKKGEELSYDYGFNYDKDYKNFPCKCGSKKCVGYIVREGSRWRIKKIKKGKINLISLTIKALLPYPYSKASLNLIFGLFVLNSSKAANSPLV